ncbi:MAG: Smr/MutS family protein [Desulfobacterales bacterium]|nr:Smr/MutS family protein [Desulfobacterales bacterium]
MKNDLKKLFGGMARVTEGALPAKPVKKKKKKIASPSKPKPRVEPKATDQAEEDFASLFAVPDEKPVHFIEAVEDTLKEEEFSELAREKQERDTQPGVSLEHYPPPQENLDLHGFTGDQAEMRVESFIIAARRRCLRTLRIITGKGRHSPGRTAVLPGIVAAKVRELKERGLVAGMRPEKKGGALLVYLTD